MICPFCSNKTRIYNSRSTHSSTQTWRRHKCLFCGRTFTTKEKIDWTGKITVQTPETTSPYSRERLLLSLVRAGNNLTLPTGTLSELADTIELELQASHFFTEGIQASDLIVQTATTVLGRFDANLALQYVNQVYRNKPPLELIKGLVGA